MKSIYVKKELKKEVVGVGPRTRVKKERSSCLQPRQPLREGEMSLLSQGHRRVVLVPQARVLYIAQCVNLKTILIIQ